MSWTIDDRKAALGKLYAQIEMRREDICAALAHDLHKSAGESYATEIGPVLREIRTQRRNMRRWSRTQCVGTPLFMWPSRSRIVCEPRGRVLIIAPWNYPFQLVLLPLVGAVAAGNSVVAKGSPAAGATERVVRAIIQAVFDPVRVSMAIGGAEKVEALLTEKWDYIFFTGSIATGRIVAQAAARQLTPITLELGGKSPCVVSRQANIEVAARRVAWGKFLNAGQTCVAPDYVFVDQAVAEQFCDCLQKSIGELFGADARASDSYGRIISDQAFDRLVGLCPSAVNDRSQRYIAPTVVRLENADHELMSQEIFGPLLPVMTYDEPSQAVEYIKSHEKPLALYYFGVPRDAMRLAALCASGGMCVNDTVMHLANDHLPFGGVGASGMGAYHGRYSFDTFAVRRSVLTSSTWIDLPMRYFPNKYLKLLTHFLK